MPVTHRRLGRHGVLVSNLCLGTINFGPQADQEQSFAIMDRALELGINFFDTADGYGWTPHGLTEEIIGRWFAQGGGRREAVVLATKVYNPADREGSLRRLRTETIDLYQMHHVDRECPWEEIWGAIGPRTVEQLESAVRATEIVLDAATLARLDEMFPGPGGEAPKAYAW